MSGLSVVTDTAGLTAARLALSGDVAVVMTMGALHEGHAALVRAAAALADAVLVTVFVNPLQFGRGEDLDRYPRTLDDDLDLAEREGATLAYVPDVADVYGSSPVVTVDPGPLGRILEGASRPTHFAGVLTVVAKLLHRTRPDVALFGEKDYQQLVLIRRMVSDLDFPVRVLGIPTVREQDGLALSSRNRFLDEAERAAAAALPAALRAGAARGALGAAAVVDASRAVLGGVRAPIALEVDYVAVRGVDLQDAPASGEGRLLAAVRVGGTRLIDNVPIRLEDGARELAATLPDEFGPARHGSDLVTDPGSKAAKER